MLGVIAGTGLNNIVDFEQSHAIIVDTPYGPTSGELLKLAMDDKQIVLLPRHGKSHSVPPHKINYRANIWAMKEAGVTEIVAFAAVGGITPAMSPSTLVLPDQLIDYTYSREQTFFTENFSADQHIDFTYPYSASLRQRISEAAQYLSVDIVQSGTYACTQGPRLETAAEVQKLKQDGCDIVGMTAMPEAALARELQMDYQTFAIVVNWAAGVSNDAITIASIRSIMQCAEDNLQKIIAALLEV